MTNLSRVFKSTLSVLLPNSIPTRVNLKKSLRKPASAPITVPFPSLSKTRRPSTKSSNVPSCWVSAIDFGGSQFCKKWCYKSGGKIHFASYFPLPLTYPKKSSNVQVFVFISSFLGFPKTPATSLLVGLKPKPRIKSPTWLKNNFPSPVLSRDPLIYPFKNILMGFVPDLQ